MNELIESTVDIKNNNNNDNNNNAIENTKGIPDLFATNKNHVDSQASLIEETIDDNITNTEEEENDNYTSDLDETEAEDGTDLIDACNFKIEFNKSKSKLDLLKGGIDNYDDYDDDNEYPAESSSSIVLKKELVENDMNDNEENTDYDEGYLPNANDYENNEEEDEDNEEFNDGKLPVNATQAMYLQAK